ncbi:psbP domain-containing protein 2, chloroplastic-like [Typha latifolia]|uniref:psbP domain-containing protein 2, chloroplastic-like n=1 Tax=Typha latifolia TaxID=4733 RepID=UPI003C2B4631
MPLSPSTAILTSGAAISPVIPLIIRRLDSPQSIPSLASVDQPDRLLSHSSTSNHEKPRITRRAISSLLLFPFLIPSPAATAAAAAGASLSLEVDLERYTDQSEGFTLLKPASWRKVEKAGATALFEEEGKGINNIGIVVSPVRLSSLRDFGTPEFVADKLIQAERRKESTKDANVLGVAERWCQNGFPVYEIEYRVDSSRGGMKRIFSAAFVASNKLYLLNIAHSDPPDDPLDNQTRGILEQVLHSFDVVV